MDPFPIRTMEEEIITDVSVTDVYDQAAGIGKEFEKLIESYGVESVTDLMPKVIRALEQLEALAGKYEKESHEISDLRHALDKLETEKADKNQERVRFEEELIQIEDEWQKESKEQTALIGKLQEENRRLKASLSEQKQAVVEEVAAITKKTEEKEIEVLTKLKETVDKQREELRKVGRELKQKHVDVEALQAQSENLVKINIELRRKNQTHRKHARGLITEKVDLETMLAEKEQQIVQNQTHRKHARGLITEKVDLETMLAEKEQQIVQVKELLKEQESLDDAEKSTPGSIPGEKQTMDGATVSLVTEGDVHPDDDNPENLIEKLSTIGKIIIDKQDPNRPRFTLNELRTVLIERNELKAQLMEVEEELEIFKPSSVLDDYVLIDDNTNMNALGEEEEDFEQKSRKEDEELPVQGPINKEPFEKVYGRKQSGIRRFFSSLFGESSKSGLPE